MTGVEWVIDARGCDPGKLTDQSALAALFHDIVRDLSLHVVESPMWHVFPTTGGITGLCMLAESHLTVHTFPEHQSLCLNVFCCRPRGEWDVEGHLRGHVGATDVEIARIERSYAELSATRP